MKKPLYNFGDVVKAKIRTEVSGVHVDVYIEKVICAIRAIEYSISDSSPQTTIKFDYGVAQDMMFQKHFVWVDENDIERKIPLV